MGHDVFVSHSSKDKPFADAVVATLERHGVRCWVAPRDILPGESWANSILKAIESSRLMLLIFSGNANDSPHIKREVERAVHRQIPVAPIRVQEIMPENELEYFLSGSHWMDAITPPFARHLDKLAQQVRLMLKMGGEEISSVDPILSDPQIQAVLDTRTGIQKSTKRRRLFLISAMVFIVLIISAVVVWKHLTHQLGTRIGKTGSPVNSVDPAGTPPRPPPIKFTAPPMPTGIGETCTNSVGMKFAYIPAGVFTMGSPTTESGRMQDEVPHKVTLFKKFTLAITTVTQAQWKAVMGNNPSFFKGDDLPVTFVDWNDAVAFCRQLSQNEGRHYRLPTEAEWEYACRAGTKTEYNTGDDEQALNDAGWYTANSEGAIHPVAQKKPNAWGLFDMHGNVQQWCSDWYNAYPNGEAINPEGPAKGTDRVLRGGSWMAEPPLCRSAFRGDSYPSDRLSLIGFRPVLEFESQ